MPSSVRKLPSYQAFDAQSSTTFSSTKMTDDITEDEETALISPDLVGVSHQDADLLKGGIKGVISVLLLGRLDFFGLCWVTAIGDIPANQSDNIRRIHGQCRYYYCLCFSGEDFFRICQS